tara:strand:+ start:954 stop:1169 length:216 start_codon:yes stop_codon:yes gene_type:complete
MNDIRRFYILRVLTGELVLVKEGETGFYVQHGMNQPTADALNDLYKNTPADLEAAEAGSMFGWDCPAAQLA